MRLTRIVLHSLFWTTLIGAYGALHAEFVFTGYDWKPRPSGHLAFSPDGRFLAVSANYEIHIRKAPDYVISSTIKMPEGAITSLAYGSDGRLYAGDMNGVIAAFLPGKTEPDTVEGMKFPVDVIAVSPDGKTIAASGEMGGSGRVAVLEAGTLKTKFEIPARAPYELIFANADTLIGIRDSFIIRFDLNKRIVARARDLSYNPYGLAVNHAEGIVYTGSFLQRTLLFDAGTLRDITSFQDSYRASPVRTVVYHAGREMLLTGEDIGFISIRDPKTGKAKYRLAGHINAVDRLAVSPDGNTIASVASGSKELIIWTKSDFKKIVEPKTITFLNEKAKKLLLIPGHEGLLALVDKVLRRYDREGKEQESAEIGYSVADWRAQGDDVLLYDKKLTHVLSWKDLKERTKYPDLPSTFLDRAVFQKAKTEGAFIIRTAGKKSSREVPTETGDIDGIAGAENHFCVVGTREYSKTAKGYERIMGVEMRRLDSLDRLFFRVKDVALTHRDSSDFIKAFCPTPDRAYILTTKELSVLGKDPAEDITIRARGSIVLSAAAFSPNGRRLALSDRLGVIRIYQAHTMKLEQVVTTKYNLPGVEQLSLTDGGILHALTGDGILYTWDID